MKGKRGRPSKVETLTVAQLALNQVEFMAKFSKIDNALTSLVQGVQDFVNSANKTNQELAKRIQTLDSRCEDLEKKIVSKEAEVENPLSELDKDSDC